MPMSGVWTEGSRVEGRGIDGRAGVGGPLASGLPRALGGAAGEPDIGVAACFGGLNAALAVPRGNLRARLGWGTAAALSCGVSFALATAVQDSVAASAAVAFVWVGLAAFLRTFGPSGGLTGFVAGAIFVIANGIPAGSLDVGTRTLWFMLGSLLGLVLMVAAHGRDAPPPDAAAPPLGRVLERGARELRDAVAGDAL